MAIAIIAVAEEALSVAAAPRGRAKGVAAKKSRRPRIMIRPFSRIKDGAAAGDLLAAGLNT
jgi:hypothetical protein